MTRSDELNGPVPVDLSHQRREYENTPLDDDQMRDSPFDQFQDWYQQATSAQVLEPNAMVISTVTADGRPAQRTVLLKYYDVNGFVFFTNYDSRKAGQMAENPHVSLHFLWLPLQRQVEINGVAAKVSTAESLKYFALRPRGSQLGAWVSQQSSVISSRSLLEAKFNELKQKFAHGEIPLPSFWGGFRVTPSRVEFLQGQSSRMHDRFEYLPSGEGRWIRQRLSP
jgi:pyridoxamine 5'-phosphate oxidase